MAWWQYVLIVGVLLAGIYGFVVLTGNLTGFLSRRTDRTAESMYGDYADSPRKRRYAQRHGGQWHDEETRSSNLTASPPRPPRKTA